MNRSGWCSGPVEAASRAHTLPRPFVGNTTRTRCLLHITCRLLNKESYPSGKHVPRDATRMPCLHHKGTVPKAVSSDNQSTTDEIEEEEEAVLLAHTLCRVAEDLKGQATRALYVEGIIYWTTVMVFTTVTNRPQLLAMCAKMEAAALEKHKYPLLRGRRKGGSTWEVLDFGDVVVHIQSAAQREYYDIESIFSHAKEIDLGNPESSL